MKALLCTSFGSPENLIIKDIEPLRVSLGKVVIQVFACGVNFPDTLIIRDMYQIKPTLPFTPGGEVSGIVKEAAKDVHHLKPGDRVFALCTWGGMAEEVEVDADRVFPLLPSMDFLTGATVMYNYATSIHALRNRAELKSGETLLVLGAAGGVGLAAIELGKVMGATVIAAASTKEKLNICQSKGADHLINYTGEDLKDKVKHLTSGKGVDVIFDPVGGQYTDKALRCIAWKGRYLVVGFAGGEIPKIPANLILLKSCQVLGVFWGQFSKNDVRSNKYNLHLLEEYYLHGHLRPAIHQIYPLKNAGQAISDLMNRKVIGKAVVMI